MNSKYIMGILCLTLLYISPLHAHKKSDAHITGHVIDAHTTEHIPYVTIGIKGTTLGTVSDPTGHFLLKDLPPGKQVVVVTFMGYQSIEQEVEVLPEKTIEVKLMMMPKAIEMDEVVVSASRNETNKRLSSTIVNVISNKLFEKTASNNVAEVLNFKPGLRVEYSCSNCGVPQLRINGLEGQYSQILLDSRPLFSSLAAVYGLEQLPAGMIERVEVIRGGGSALFGSSAIGGVVNIITSEPRRNTLSLSNNSGFYAGGSDINTTLNGSFVTDDARAGVYIFGMMKDRSPYDRDGDGFSEIPAVGSETVGFRGYYKFSSLSRLTAEYHHIREFRRGGNHFDLPEYESDIAEQLRHKINGGGLKYDLSSSDHKHRMGLYASVQHIDRNSYFGTNQNLKAYGTTDDLTLVAGGQYTYTMDRLLFMPSELTLGAEYSDNHLDDRMPGYNRTIQQRSICYGGFVQNEWKNDQLNILIGARLDKHNKVSSPIFSPRVNLRYTPITHVGLRLSYSSGYRAPQAYEEDLHVAAVGGEVAIISIDPNLKPEYSHSVSGSVDLYYNFSGVEVNLLVEGFYTDLENVFKLREVGHDAQGNLLLERHNASGARIAGVNLELKMGFSPKLIVEGGFTLQNSRYKEAESWSQDPSVLPQKRMLRSPDRYGYLTLNYQPIRPFTASLTTNYTGPMLVPHHAGYVANDQETLSADFWEIGVRFAYDFKLTPYLMVQLNAGVKNILDSFQPDLDRGSLRDAGYIYGPAQPRTYFIGAKVTL